MNNALKNVFAWSHARMEVITRRYARAFSLHEIEESLVLKVVCGVFLLSSFQSFTGWINNASMSIRAYVNNTHLCWPHFQSCGEWYFFETLPFGHSQSIFYMCLFAVCTLAAYCMYKKQWVAAHALLVVIWTWKVLVTLFLTKVFAANFNYYDVILGFVLLFVPFKLYFLQLTLVWMYFLAGSIKIHEGWVLGTYFTSLQSGLPIFGNALAPLFTNAVIFMQIVGSWFLLQKRGLLFWASLSYFTLFHLYSGIYVDYRYPTIALGMLLALFLLPVERPKFPLERKALLGWFFLALLMSFQLIAILIPGDQKLTLEGNYYGLYMFEANHQCVSKVEFAVENGPPVGWETASVASYLRCDPFDQLFKIQQVCKRDENVVSARWTFDHSINGGPFYRIVDEGNACDLSYKIFKHNEWIRTPEEGAPIMGYPYKNFFD